MEENGCLTPDSLEEFDVTVGFNSNINNTLRCGKNGSHEHISINENSSSSNVHYDFSFRLNNRVSVQSTSVPPLNLLSEESSIIEATDNCKEAFEIDLRAPYKADMHCAEKQKNSDEIVSDHWNQYSDQLVRLKLDQRKSCNSAKVDYNNRSSEPIRTKNGYEFLIKELNRTKNDFIKLNKKNLGCNKLISPKTYGQLFEDKLHRNCVDNHPENYKSKLAQKHRICFSSDPTLCKVLWKDVKSNSHIHLAQQQKIYDYSPWHGLNKTKSLNRINCTTSHKLYHNGSYSGFQEDSINWLPVNHLKSQPQYQHILPQTANPDGLSTVMQSPLKRKNDSIFPTSVSGVYRLGLLQQVELTKAHKHFCHKLNSNFYDCNTHNSFSTVHTRLDSLCSPNLMIKHTNLLNSQLTKHNISDSSINNNSTKCITKTNCSNKKITDTILQQYILRDYYALPSFKPIKPIISSPHFNSHEYRKKLTPKFRQDGYAEYLRRCREHKLPKLTCYKNHPILQKEKDSQMEDNKNTSKHSILNRISNDNENCEKIYGKLLNSSNGTIDSNSTSQTDHTNLTEIASSSIQDEPTKRQLVVDFSKDMDKTEAIKKREKMLSYAKKVQKRYQEKYQPFIKNDNFYRQNNLSNSNPKPHQTNSIENWKNLDLKLMEMIQRHREERKEVEKMQKSLKIPC